MQSVASGKFIICEVLFIHSAEMGDSEVIMACFMTIIGMGICYRIRYAFQIYVATPILQDRKPWLCLAVR